MPETTCAYTKPDGTPCAARPLPGRPFCLFHDPGHAESQTEARRKGGAAPRRRIRRFPRLLDYQHVAELLSELFITSLNDPAAIDCKRLQALTTLARTLLKAVGTPAETYMEHDDRIEPTPAADHLVRIYPPLPLEIEALLAAERADAEPAPTLPASSTSAAVAATPAPGNSHLPIAASPSSDPSDPSDHPSVALTGEQAAEEAPDRWGTGHSAVSTSDDQAPGAWRLASDRWDTPEHPSPSTQNPPSDAAPTAAPIASPPPASPSPAADEALPEPEPRHILVDPHAPWPTADALRPTRGYLLVDLPFDPTRRFAG